MQELVHQHSIFKLLFQALSRSLHLLLRATSKEKKQAMLFKACTELQILLSAYVEGWHCSMLNMPQQETAAEKQLARQQLQETDLLQTFSAACVTRLGCSSSSSSSSSSTPGSSGSSSSSSSQRARRRQAAKKQRPDPGSLTAAQADAAASCSHIAGHRRCCSSAAQSIPEPPAAGVPELGGCVAAHAADEARGV
ncbi:hypothetical protein OEZ86_005442 [Tetradesmus obliquus]|nr:hypothetical protein OEZ86_005442 [Tetradesmus obliquus]